MTVVSLKEFRAVRAERDALKRRLEAMMYRPVRSPEREREAAESILAALPCGLRQRVIVEVSTLGCGDLYATASLGRRFVGLPQSNFSYGDFVRHAARLFAFRLFVSDIAASIPPNQETKR